MATKAVGSINVWRMLLSNLAMYYRKASEKKVVGLHFDSSLISFMLEVQ